MSKRRGRDDDFRVSKADESTDSGANDSDGDEDDDLEMEVDSDLSDRGGMGGGPRRNRLRSPNKRGKLNAKEVPRSGRAKELKGKGKAWEGQFRHTWDSVREDERGTLEGAVENILLGAKSRRILRDTTSIQRGIIRHVFLVIDLSLAMLVREFKSSWLDLTLGYAREFVAEFFDQNPISQMAILITREGSAERLSPLSGNPQDHLKALSNKKKLDARGEPSLQNVLEMARAGLSHLPPHGSREVIVILGSLTTCDPGNIHETIKSVVKDRVRVNIIGLSAEMRICKDICTQTKGIYNVALSDFSLRDILFTYVSPPPTLAPNTTATTSAPISTTDLMLMGFPSLLSPSYPALCACHSKLKSEGYGCPRCRSRICDVPSECGVCGLMVVSSPHLARSWRHLFPVANYNQIQGEPPPKCFSCQFPFPLSTRTGGGGGMYQCGKCENIFCLDCDVLVHEALGFCPGCV